MMLSDSVVHDLAVAYAQVKLIQEQQRDPGLSGYDDEIRSFLKHYNHARYQIPIECEDLDECF